MPPPDWASGPTRGSLCASRSSSTIRRGRSCSFLTRWGWTTFSRLSGFGAGSARWRGDRCPYPSPLDRTKRATRKRPDPLMPDRGWLTGEERDASLAVARLLAGFTGRDRAEAVHMVLKELRRRTEPDRVLACELAWEVHAGGYWSQLRADDGSPYENEETYFRDVLGVAS